MPRKPTIGITTGEFRFGGSSAFRLVLKMSPIWDKMAAEFADVTTEVLRDEMLNIARETGKEMLRQIRIRALPHSYTGRLADTQKTWRYWITPRGPGGRGKGTYGPQWYVTVGLHQPATVSETTGRPVQEYAHAIELGGKPQYPLGKLARERIKSWAARKGLTKTQAHAIARSIYQKGTGAYPYFAPAARATASAAVGCLNEGGRNWKDKVEAYFGAS